MKNDKFRSIFINYKSDFSLNSLFKDIILYYYSISCV